MRLEPRPKETYVFLLALFHFHLWHEKNISGLPHWSHEENEQPGSRAESPQLGQSSPAQPEARHTQPPPADPRPESNAVTQAPWQELTYPPISSKQAKGW